MSDRNILPVFYKKYIILHVFLKYIIFNFNYRLLTFFGIVAIVKKIRLLTTVHFPK